MGEDPNEILPGWAHRIRGEVESAAALIGHSIEMIKTLRTPNVPDEIFFYLTDGTRLHVLDFGSHYVPVWQRQNEPTRETRKKPAPARMERHAQRTVANN